MGNIGGNRTAVIQVMDVARNKIGESETVHIDALQGITGWLDLSGGDSRHLDYNAKVQESTHIFLCDYLELEYKVEGRPDIKITPENSRMVIDGEVYEVMLYDDPMGMHEHFEIYLKYTGGR
ncbi:MAG: hypothetical protein K2P38_18315 [Lachnospiraceae bacterium]|nr:hypothetical protein [Lachnospiraceae bacterium]